MTLNTLHDHLSRHNLALENVGSISEQSIAGIVATASHGSGVTFGSMSCQVVSLTLLFPDGSRVLCSRQQEQSLFLATLCGLGSTGFITTVQIACQPAFRLKEVATNVPFNEYVSHLHDIATSAEHVRCWWFAQRGLVRVSRCNRTFDVRLSVFMTHIFLISVPVRGPLVPSCRSVVVPWSVSGIPLSAANAFHWTLLAYSQCLDRVLCQLDHERKGGWSWGEL